MSKAKGNGYIFKFQVNTSGVCYIILHSLMVCITFGKRGKKERKREVERVLMTKYKVSRYIAHYQPRGWQVFNVSILGVTGGQFPIQKQNSIWYSF